MIIDGININAAHFSAMKEADAVKSMVADGFVPGANEKEKEEWAKKAYSLINPKVEKLSKANAQQLDSK